MKTCLFSLLFVILLLIGSVHAQNIVQPAQKILDFPEVPRISAFEAYQKYKAGKAIIIHAGGELYERRHIMGAHDVNADAVILGQTPLPNFPMKGLDLYTYCH